MQTYAQWCCGELTFTDDAAPHAVDCGLEAVFTAPSGKQLRRAAFWNGENIFAVRFALTELGAWTYRLCGTAAPQSGMLECVPYGGALPLYRHGFLKVAPQGSYLCYADETPFFWLGDTHWQFAVEERWNESNDPRFVSQFRAVVDKRVQQKFTVYQCNFHCEAAPQHGKTDLYFTKQGDTYVPNLEFFTKNLDPKMAYLAENGLCIAAGFSWFFSAFAPDAEAYYMAAVQYLIARYGAYPMVWTLAGEVGGYAPSRRAESLAFWRKIALQVQAQDAYNHLQTAHYTNERPFAQYYQTENWFDFTLNQSGHGDYPIDCRPFLAHRAAYDAKPFIESESLYENILTLEPNGRRRATPEMLRRVAYLAMQNGACGYTYGAQGLWHFQWEQQAEDAPNLGFGSFPAWYEAIDFPGADQLTILREIYEELQWHTLRPLSPQHFVQDTSGGLMLTFDNDDLQALFMPSVQANEAMDTIVAYYAPTNRFTIGFRALKQPRYKAYWQSPETGEKTIIEANLQPQNGGWFAPMKQTESDALLVLRAIKESV